MPLASVRLGSSRRARGASAVKKKRLYSGGVSAPPREQSCRRRAFSLSFFAEEMPVSLSVSSPLSASSSHSVKLAMEMIQGIIPHGLEMFDFLLSRQYKI